MKTEDQERDSLRELARQVAEIAACPENARIKQRWRDVNALRQPDRASVWCRPVGAWAELLPEKVLGCTDPWRRAIERELRQTLIKHDIGDDNPVDPWLPVPVAWRVDPPNLWGVDVHHRTPDTAGGAWAYDPPLKTDADFNRLRMPRFTPDPRRTEEALEKAADLLGDLLPPRPVCDTPLHATLCVYAAELRGLTPLLMDMASDPKRVHRLMRFLRDSVLTSMDTAESSGLLSPNNNGPMTCSDPVGTKPADDTYTFRNLWAMANSQEFDPVSPAMWREFLLEYQRPILERFGMTAYGCCENLTRKMEGVLSLSNLRIFVCSAWTNLDAVIERIGRTRVIMWRQRASDVVFTDDPAVLRTDLEAGMRKLQGCRYQVVLRELQTLAGHPRRLHEWTRVAIEMAEKYA